MITGAALMGGSSPRSARKTFNVSPRASAHWAMAPGPSAGWCWIRLNEVELCGTVVPLLQSVTDREFFIAKLSHRHKLFWL
jgi:hypothetical protein